MQPFLHNNTFYKSIWHNSIIWKIFGKLGDLYIRVGKLIHPGAEVEKIFRRVIVKFSFIGLID